MKRALIAITAASLAIPAVHARGQDSGKPILERLADEATKLAPLAEGEIAKGFLAAVDRLPNVKPRVLYVNRTTRDYRSANAWRSLDEDARAGFKPQRVGPDRYYRTKYGTPLAFFRVLDVAERFGFESLVSTRVLDFGYGTVGHLRLLASRGADATGVDVDPFLRALYAQPSDRGTVVNRGLRDGVVRLAHGRWPAEAAVVKTVGRRFDLIVSKNTLKRGYLEPAEKVNPRMLVDLGVSQAVFLEKTFAALEPGGLFVIYNLSPKPSPPGKPYKPWADGRSPFTKTEFEAAGFEVLALDETDDDRARAMGQALGWDRQMGDLKENLFALFSVARKPADE